MNKTGAGELNFREIWNGALTFEQFVAQAAPEHRALWEGVHRHAKSPEWAASLVDGRRMHIIAITEDWCIDTSSTVPFLDRLAESVEGVELRIILRDQNPEIMDHYLTNGARAIPVVIVLDGEFRPIGRWGPRPAELQAWVLANKGVIPNIEKIREQRRWYARDKGETTVREVLQSTTEWPARGES